jgi:hypothetical protein
MGRPRLRRAGFLVREQPRDFDDTWSLMAYSAATLLASQDRQVLYDIAPARELLGDHPAEEVTDEDRRGQQPGDDSGLVRGGLVDPVGRRGGALLPASSTVSEPRQRMVGPAGLGAR